MIDLFRQKELRDKFNPDGSQLRTMQLRMLEILKYIDKICRKHNIPYWLSSGTCLGAIRHGGFIPWDDDVDIELLEKDYKRLCRILEADSEAPYNLQNHKTDSSFFWPFSKLREKNSEIEENNGIDKHYKYHGLFVDIFVMEFSSSNFVYRLGLFAVSLCLKTNKINNYRLRHFIAQSIYILVFRIMIPFLKFFIPRDGQKIRHKCGTPFFKERYISDIFPLSETEFEGCKFYIPGRVG